MDALIAAPDPVHADVLVDRARQTAIAEWNRYERFVDSMTAPSLLNAVNSLRQEGLVTKSNDNKISITSSTSFSRVRARLVRGLGATTLDVKL